MLGNYLKSLGSYLKQLRADLSISALVAGFIVVLVGFTSTIAIVFQAAQALGATQAEINSWVWALGLGMGSSCIALSLYYKKPIITAWSTPGAALIAATQGISLSEATGAFLVFAALINYPRWVERCVREANAAYSDGVSERHVGRPNAFGLGSTGLD